MNGRKSMDIVFPLQRYAVAYVVMIRERVKL